MLGDSCRRSHLTCLHRLLSFQVSAVCRAESGCVFALTRNVSVYLMNSDRKGQCDGDNRTENMSDIMVIQVMSKLYQNKLSWLAIECLFSCVDTAKWLGSKRERGERAESKGMKAWRQAEREREREPEYTVCRRWASAASLI